jgi:hypothetical protein
MYDLIIIGAGPGGIALAAEAYSSGIVDRYRVNRRRGRFACSIYKIALEKCCRIHCLRCIDALDLREVAGYLRDNLSRTAGLC